MPAPYKGERGEMTEEVVCFYDMSHLKNNQEYVWVHKSTAMQMKFLNNPSPPGEEAGGELGKWWCANIPTITEWCGDTHTKCVNMATRVCHTSKWGHIYTRHHANKHNPDVQITKKPALRLHVQLVHANDQAWHPPSPTTSIASTTNTSEWCRWSHTNCVDVTTCMSQYNWVVDIPHQHNTSTHPRCCM